MTGLFDDIVNLEKIGKLSYAIAAVCEGFCPVHAVRLEPVVVVVDDPMDDYDSPALASGMCLLCPATWASGNDGFDWIAIDDVHQEMRRRLVMRRLDVEHTEDWEEGDEDSG